MSIISRMRKQDAVWFAQSVPDDFGQQAYEAAVEIKCRWEDKAVKFLLENGTEAVSAAVVYVDRVMKIGDILIEGLIVDLEDKKEPKRNKRVFEIKGFEKLPNLRNTEVLYTAMMQ